MRVLDLCAGAMGAGYGYTLAGHDVIGLDVHKRADLPPDATLVVGDLRAVPVDWVRTFDFVHASPPCQTHSITKNLRNAQGKSTTKLDLIPDARRLLEAAGVPYVIENVPGAPLRTDLLLCGSMFPSLATLDEAGNRRWLKRHRIFEFGNGAPVPAQLTCCTCQSKCTKPTCGHRVAGVRAMGVYASKGDSIPSGGQTASTLEQGRQLMGMPWASWAGLVEAIPPAYTEYIGRSL